MGIEIKEEYLFKRGRMKKNPFTMTQEEKTKWNEQVEDQIRNYLFSLGQPLVYCKEGKMVAEYPNGTIKNV